MKPLISTLLIAFVASLPLFSGDAVLPENAKRWQGLSELEKARYRELYTEYMKLPPEKQKALERRMKIYKSLEPKAQLFVQRNYRDLRKMSEEQQESLLNLLKWFQDAPKEQKKMMSRAFGRAFKLPRRFRIQLYPLVADEYMKASPQVIKVIDEFVQKHQ